ncbi:8271_t:CDS:1 [Dentiscutata erythropus]|uniref:8271_t:CDS:1 n=1 Tax=Dentiscutata erythropus TaxID=1348616 RepID=A0A9N9IGX9_9GLOM|nr:8271_t:CDS:1 [Dentiscutata erythropus]
MKFGGEILKCTKDQPPTRYLGIWIEYNSNQRTQLKKMEQRINHTTAAIRRAKVTDKQIKYIYNQVLNSQILYLAQNLIPKEKWIQKQEAKLRSTFKYKVNLPKDISNLIIHSGMGYKLFDLKSRIYRQAIIEFKERLESNQTYGTTTRIRTQTLQNKIWLTTPI